MPFPIQIWLVHPDAEPCDAFSHAFEGLPDVRVVRGRLEDLPAVTEQSCGATPAGATSHRPVLFDGGVHPSPR